MNPLDRLVATFSPIRGLKRAQARRLLAYYEGGEATRLRKLRRDSGSGDAVVARAGKGLRNLARHLDENHDLARGALNVLVANVVGAPGIQPEPQPRRADGTIHEELARDLLALWRDWSRRPEVTHELTWPMVQRLVARTWLRDGEALAQHLDGAVQFLDHGTRVPYSIELIEADLLPHDLNDASRGITAGVERNAWGRPRAYHLYRQHPGDVLQTPTATSLRVLPAARVTHLKLTERIRQARGVPIFAAVLTRLDDLKDYEESERIAAKVAASMCAAIVKGSPDTYAPANPLDPADPAAPRHMTFRPGMVFDELQPGERVEPIDSKRPNPNAEAWRSGQLRAVAAGMGTSYSSLARDYNGTYSAQRQELVEQWGHYQVLAQHFTAQFVQPVWERFVANAISAGALRVPAEVLAETVDDALFCGPSMPWIDPKKEMEAWLGLEQAGYASGPEIIRRRGANPREVLEQEANWRRMATDKGLVLTSDPANARAAAPAPAPEPDPDDTDTDDDDADTPPRRATGGRNA